MNLLLLINYFVMSSNASTLPVIDVIMDQDTHKEVWAEVLNGVKLADDEINYSHQNVIFNYLNSGSTAAGSRAQMLTLRKPFPDVTVAEIDSSKAMIAGEVAEKNRMVMITPFATSPRVTENKEFVFRACVADDEIGSRLAKYALKELKAKKVAVIYDAGQLYSVTLRDVFKKAINAAGGEVVYESAILSSTDAYQSMASEVVKSRPDIIFLPFYEETVSRFLVQAIKADGFSNLKLLGSDGWASGSFFNGNSVDAFKGLDAVWVSHFDPNLKFKQAAEFSKKYKKKFNSTPNTSASYLGYDAVMFSYKAIRNVKGALTAEKIRNSFKTLRNFVGSTGAISFDKSNDPSKPLFLIRHSKGAITSGGELN